MNNYSTQLQAFSSRFSDQRQKRAAYLKKKKTERLEDKSKEFNLVNAIVSGGTAWIASGGNPLAAGIAALTSKPGETDFLQAGVSGLAKGTGVSQLQAAGAAGEGAAAAAGEAGKGDLIQTLSKQVTDIGKGIIKEPGTALQAAKAYVPGQEASSLQGLDTAKKQRRATELQTKAATQKSKLDERRVAATELQARAAMQRANASTKTKNDLEKEVRKQYTDMTEALSQAKQGIKLRAESIRTKVSDLKGASESNIAEMQRDQQDEVSRFFYDLTAKDPNTKKTRIDLLADKLEQRGIPASFAKQMKNDLMVYINELKNEYGL